MALYFDGLDWSQSCDWVNSICASMRGCQGCETLFFFLGFLLGPDDASCECGSLASMSFLNYICMFKNQRRNYGPIHRKKNAIHAGRGVDYSSRA
jgi:hypothetical protein